ncbi:MAG: glucosyltransferase [Caeruleum heppii]|nr:MAG: glucosyltransferase [Caeruleum heppii]
MTLFSQLSAAVSVPAQTILSLALFVWLNGVNEIVPSPYLDEEFHIRQAQAYCDGQWQTWDPKITTPPGFYIFSLLPRLLTSRACSPGLLRTGNALLLLILQALAQTVSSYVTPVDHPTEARAQGSSGSAAFPRWTGLNLSLFPVLFFFSALYYTDVGSTCCVLAAYALYLRRGRSPDEESSSVRTFLQVLIGLLALSFRQTNIFWVAVFLAGRQIVRTASFNVPRSYEVADCTLGNIVDRSWRQGELYDPSAGDAYLEDYAKTIVSLLVVAATSIRRLVRTVLAYLVVLLAFAAFVLWNGGVVLGDKSNHTATIHLPQLLYIWPCFVFFALPLLLPHILTMLATLSPLRTRCISTQAVPRVRVLGAWLVLMLLAVHYNTVIHPFTLADNRHYTFYVFRWFLLRHPLARHLAVPIYIFCGWVVIHALSGHPNDVAPAAAERKMARRNAWQSSMPSHRNRVSFVLVWLGATTLSLVTAPLVEPRYFIVPWVIWRLHLPYRNEERKAGASRAPNSLWKRVARGDSQILLLLETGWFMVINVITGYLFLYKGFSWPQEPGRVQRFMW